MKTSAYFVAILGLMVFIAITVTTQLTGEKTPAEAFCEDARGQGLKCTVAPDTFNAQAVVVQGVEGSAGFLVLHKDGKLVGVVPIPKQ